MTRWIGLARVGLIGFNQSMKTRITLFAILVSLALKLGAAELYPDRFVWVFGWRLAQDTDVAEVSRLVETASQHGINGAVVSFGFDSLCRQSADYFRRLEELRRSASESTWN